MTDSNLETKMCPKCITRPTPMTRVDVTCGLPNHIGPDIRSVSDKTPAISISDALVVQPYFCPNCRFVELYAT